MSTTTTRRTTRTHADALARVGLNSRTLAARLQRHAAAATDETWALGRTWYAAGQRLAMELGAISQTSQLHGACVIAATSPRTPWERNVVMAREIAAGGTPSGLGSNVSKAQRCLASADPMARMGEGPKTRAFAANLNGDEDQVTLDVWMVRAFGITESMLDRVGVYDALSAIVRRLAARYDVTPAQLQAVVWIHVRGAAE